MAAAAVGAAGGAAAWAGAGSWGFSPPPGVFAARAAGSGELSPVGSPFMFSHGSPAAAAVMGGGGGEGDVTFAPTPAAGAAAAAVASARAGAGVGAAARSGWADVDIGCRPSRTAQATAWTYINRTDDEHDPPAAGVPIPTRQGGY